LILASRPFLLPVLIRKHPAPDWYSRAEAASVSGVELWWLGQSGFRLRDPAGGPAIFVDPYLTPRQSRTWQAPVGPEALAAAGVVLCTHEHLDHFDQPSLRAAAATEDSRFTLVVPKPIVDQALALGLPPERVIGAVPNEPLRFDGVQIHPVPARHGINVSDAYTFGTELSGGLVRYLGYVIEIGGVRAYHAGDCIPYDGQVEALRPLRPHLALLPINGRDYFREQERNLVGNMDPREAAHLAHEIGAAVLVPTHWELFPHNRGYPGDLVAYVENHLPDLTVLIFGRGQRLVYTPA
jgi:L-ascorbate metabolism protein UlaG (beta-lactamase superfamily)